MCCNLASWISSSTERAADDDECSRFRDGAEVDVITPLETDGLASTRSAFCAVTTVLVVAFGIVEAIKLLNSSASGPLPFGISKVRELRMYIDVGLFIETGRIRILVFRVLN